MTTSPRPTTKKIETGIYAVLLEGVEIGRVKHYSRNIGLPKWVVLSDTVGFAAGNPTYNGFDTLKSASLRLGQLARKQKASAS